MPKIETKIYSYWLRENGVFFNRTAMRQAIYFLVTAEIKI